MKSAFFACYVCANRYLISSAHGLRLGAVAVGIHTNWRGSSKTIYRNIEKALFESSMFKEKPATAFTEVAFMNYFQRPAEKTGQSIKVSTQDAEVAFSVFQGVVKATAPHTVIFTSSLAWQHAKNYQAAAFLAANGASVTRSPHPGMPWWNRASSACNNKTGREHFIAFINGEMSMAQPS